MADYFRIPGYLPYPKPVRFMPGPVPNAVAINIGHSFEPSTLPGPGSTPAFEYPDGKQVTLYGQDTAQPRLKFDKAVVIFVVGLAVIGLFAAWDLGNVKQR